MRKSILLIVVAIFALSFAPVSAQDGYSDVDPSGVTLTYWHQFNSDPQQATIEALVQQFNDTNEYGITVEPIAQGSYNDIRDLMNAAIISGELPNIVAGYQSDALSWYRDDGALDINGLLNDATWGYSEDERASLNMGIIDVNVFEEEGGIRLAWPSVVSASLQVVNMTMLNALGFEAAPTTYEEFKAVSCAAAAAEGTQGYPITLGSSEFENFAASMGAKLWHDGAWDFTSDEAIATFQLYADLYNEGCAYIPEGQYQNTGDFAISLNPMANTSTAGIPYIVGPMLTHEEENGVPYPDWIVTSTPWTDDNRVAQVFVPSNIIVPATPEEEVAAWVFLKFLTSTESQITWTTATSYFPINLEAAASLGDFEAENVYFAQANAIVSDPDITIYSSPKVISYSPVRNLIFEALADVTSNGRDVMEVAQELEEEANEIQADMQ